MFLHFALFFCEIDDHIVQYPWEIDAFIYLFSTLLLLLLWVRSK